jgi:hypothetical protein
MAEEVKVIVGADTRQLTSELDKANKAIKNFGSNVQTGANKAGLALNDVSRIVQDLPYGFIGISNNINPLVESFTRLKTETKSTGSALMAMVNSLMGPAGAGLAFGLISSAISFASVGLSRWVKTSEEAKKKTEETKNALDSIISSISKESTEVSLLIGFLQKENIERSAREEAIKKLKSLSPEYFGQLNTEKATIEQITEAYKRYNQELIKRVEGQATESQLLDVTKKILDLRQKGSKLTNEEVTSSGRILKSYTAIYDADGKALSWRERMKRIDEGTLMLTLEERNELNNLENSRKSLLESAQKYFNVSTKGTKETNDGLKSTGETINEILAKFRRQLTAEEALGLPPMEEIKAKINDYEAVIKKLITDKKVGPSSNIILNLKAELGELNDQLLFQQIYDKMLKNRREIKLMNPFVFEYTAEQQAIIDRYQQKLANESKKAALKQAELGGMGLVIPIKPKIDFSGIQGAVDKSKIDLQKIFTDSFSQLGADLATSIGEGLGNAISGKDNALQGMLDNISLILANAMVSIGKQIIVLATGLEAVYTALMSNPVTALLAGIALVALGTAAKNQLEATKAFATGTSFAPGGTALVGERGPELVNLPRGSKVIPNGKTNSMMQGAMQAVEVYGTLRGQDIYFSNKNYGKTYNRLS